MEFKGEICSVFGVKNSGQTDDRLRKQVTRLSAGAGAQTTALSLGTRHLWSRNI